MSNTCTRVTHAVPRALILIPVRTVHRCRGTALQLYSYDTVHVHLYMYSSLYYMYYIPGIEYRTADVLYQVLDLVRP